MSSHGGQCNCYQCVVARLTSIRLQCLVVPVSYCNFLCSCRELICFKLFASKYSIGDHQGQLHWYGHMLWSLVVQWVKGRIELGDTFGLFVIASLGVCHCSMAYVVTTLRSLETMQGSATDSDANKKCHACMASFQLKLLDCHLEWRSGFDFKENLQGLISNFCPWNANAFVSLHRS